MKLLITGGTGFIGSHLAESALRNGHPVNILGLTDSEADRRNADFLQSLGAQIFAGSVTDLALCRKALSNVTHVYHLAVAMREAGVSDDYFKHVNLDGTKA
ncbi:MAG: NAD-dependent epimerase/dehydratase family protein, partial [Woeseiaceae bacterium]